MSESQKRVLRERKHHNYLATEIVDGQANGYVRAGYSKEHVSPAVDLNANAKCLVKFINQINKKLKDHEMKAEEQDGDLRISDPLNHVNQPEKPKNTHSVPKKQKNTPKHQIKEHIDNGHSTDPHSNPRRPTDIDRWSGIGMGIKLPSNGNFLYGINPMSLGMPFNYPSNYKNEMELTKQLEAVQRAKLQQQILKKEILNEKMKPKCGYKEKQDKNKLFGRSAYHIAIAYHIHLQNLKKTNKTKSEIGLEELDPTFYSKKLKEQSLMESEGEK